MFTSMMRGQNKFQRSLTLACILCGRKMVHANGRRKLFASNLSEDGLHQGCPGVSRNGLHQLCHSFRLQVRAKKGMTSNVRVGIARSTYVFGLKFFPASDKMYNFPLPWKHPS